MATRILIILRLSLCSVAFWSRQLQTAQNPIVIDPPEDELASIIASHAALESYSRRPDCFRRVAANIRLRCSELEMNEEERVTAAISMTLCELATATHHSLPLECASFTVDSKQDPTVRGRGECVDALSRSAQSWSSYSGYLREVPQLCFAFRRWNDIDAASDIYKTSIMEMTTLARLLLAREQADLEGRHRLNSQLSKLENVVTRLKTIPELADAMVVSAAKQLRHQVTETIDTLKTGLADVQIHNQADNSRTIDQINMGLQLVSRRHADSLNALILSFETSVADDLTAAMSVFRTQSSDALEITNSVHESWHNLSDQFTTVQHGLSQLSDLASDTASTLQDSSQHAKDLQDSQISSARSASHLAATLANMTATTQDSLNRFNASAIQLVQSFTSRNSLTELLRFTEMFLHVEPSTIAYLHHLPIFPVASGILTFLIYVFRSSLSALMSITFILFSSRKYIVKTASEHDSLNHSVAIPHPFPHQTRVYKGPEITSRLRFRQSRIPDRLCNRGLNRPPH
ncbi:hypothetical protein R3P38DRAFT_2979840 [Favolaschia claudopus]|uniref:Nuclear fusion protein KAR5 n=1 Tax=Favolaschia claudopus TaxID=2862362 RepID=A0AAW0B2C9_9AGAR